MKSLLIPIILLFAACTDDSSNLIPKARAAKNGGGEVCFPVLKPEDAAGRYCLRYEGPAK